MSLTNVTNATQSAAEQLTRAAADSIGDTVVANTPNGLAVLFTVILPTFFVRLWELATAPFHFPEMQWNIIPLTVTFILLEVYFFRNTDEELGWNTALANGLVLLFVGIDLTRHLFDHVSPVEVIKVLFASIKAGKGVSGLMVPLFLLTYGLVLVVVTFFHLLPKSIAYKLASHAPVNFVAYIAVAAVYSEKAGTPIPLDGYTILAGTALFTLILWVIFMIQRAPGIRAFQKLRGG